LKKNGDYKMITFKTVEISPPQNSTYKKLEVPRRVGAGRLNEALCFVSSFVLAESFRLRNRQLLVAAKRYASFFKIVGI